MRRKKRNDRNVSESGQTVCLDWTGNTDIDLKELKKTFFLTLIGILGGD